MRLDPGRPRDLPVEIELVDGVRVAAANDLSAMPSWVLFEQEDWFEPELAWLRRAVRPGWRVLDSAAGCGVLAASLARAAGPGGRMLVCEAAPDLHERLQLTRRINDLPWLDPQRIALAAGPDQTAGPGQAPASGQVRRPGWTIGRLLMAEGPFDLVRLDAQAVPGLSAAGSGRRDNTPILLVRLDPGDPAAGLVAGEILQAAGFQLYHLLPGFDAAAPLDAGFLDDFTLNLIACPPERAAELAARGLLATPAAIAAARVRDRAPPPDPFTRNWPEACAGIAACLGEGLPLAARIARAETLATAWLGGLRDFVDLIHHPARLIALVRLLAATGARTTALEALRPLLHLLQSGRLALDEPALAIARPFDGGGGGGGEDGGGPGPAVPPVHEPGTVEADWLALSLLDTMGRLMAHSSFMAGDLLHPALTLHRSSAHFSPELERRRQLVARRRGELAAFEPTPPMLRSRNARFCRPGRSQAA
ncbi:hypothetical protein [Geminicoccus roseus]|uniref:hypothetical protein n=1 Tax=Geminicoccus roseus TaxID=404900 RepID=UPI00040B00E2|nr:hypothetical protein [Geminicoccus roseus]